MEKSKNRLLRKISAVALASAIVVSGAFVSGFFNKSYNENGYAFSASAAAPPSDNGSRLSTSSTWAGWTIKAYASFKGGTGSFTYKYSYRLGSGEWKDVTGYTSSKTQSIVMPSTGGNYTVRIAAKDSNGSYTSKYLYITVKKDTKTTFTQTKAELSSYNTWADWTITASTVPEGGVLPYNYKYSYKQGSGEWTDVTGYVTSSSQKIKMPSEAGNYTVRIAARDSVGTYVSKYLDIKVRKDTGKTFKENGSKLSTSSTWADWSITASGNFTGGVMPYTYKYSYKQDGGDWTDVTGYVTSSSQKIKMPSKAGNYTVRVAAKDSVGAYTSKYLNIKVKKDTGKTFKESGSKLSTGSTWADWSITAVPSFSGGVEPYTYTYSYRKDNEDWVYVVKNSSDSSARIKMPSEPGNYTVRVASNDAVGSYASKYLNITVKKDTKSEFKNNGSQAVTYTNSGGSVVARASYSGGVLPYTYKYSYKGSDGKWIDVKDYSENTSAVFDAPYKSGNYTVRIAAKDAAGKYLSQYYGLTVSSKVNDDYELAKTTAKKIVTSSMTEIQKVKKIHDWIVNNTEYDIDNYNKGTIPQSSYTVKGVIQQHKAVCQGYAETFQAMALSAGIDTEIVTGKAYGMGGYAEHMWNQVKIDNNWYNIDVTWDDPISTSDILVYDYFLVPDSVITKDHKFDINLNRCTSPTPKY